jgi:DNA-binding beta-propeller fold protein YncE
MNLKPISRRSLALAALALAGAAPAPDAAIIGRLAGPDGGWDLLSVDPAHNRLLVARSGGVMAVDLASGRVIPRFVPGEGMHAALAIPGSGIGLATAGRTNRAILFDSATGAVRAEIATGEKPDAAIYDPSTRTVWVMNAGDGTVTIIEPFKAKALASVAIGGALELPALDGRGHIFVNVEDRNEIVELGLVRRNIIRRITLTGCEEPTGLAYVAPGILISACANGVAKLVRAADGEILGQLTIGRRPDGAFADPAHHRAYVPAGEGSLTVIDTSQRLPRVIARIATQAGARTGAVDTRTGRVYLPAARYLPAPAEGKRPGMVPGSFEVLVVGPAAARDGKR